RIHRARRLVHQAHTVTAKSRVVEGDAVERAHAAQHQVAEGARDELAGGLEEDDPDPRGGHAHLPGGGRAAPPPPHHAHTPARHHTPPTTTTRREVLGAKSPFIAVAHPPPSRPRPRPAPEVRRNSRRPIVFIVVLLSLKRAEPTGFLVPRRCGGPRRHDDDD